MKCWALNIDFNGVRFDPLCSTSPQIWVPLSKHAISATVD